MLKWCVAAYVCGSCYLFRLMELYCLMDTGKKANRESFKLINNSAAYYAGCFLWGTSSSVQLWFHTTAAATWRLLVQLQPASPPCCMEALGSTGSQCGYQCGRTGSVLRSDTFYLHFIFWDLSIFFNSFSLFFFTFFAKKLIDKGKKTVFSLEDPERQ